MPFTARGTLLFVAVTVSSCIYLPSSDAFGLEAATATVHAALHHSAHHAAPSVGAWSMHGHSLHVSSSVAAAGRSVLTQYSHLLKAFPLPTKMITGATLATAGDAIAQSRTADASYSTKRAASFAIFDAAYRCLQHAAFPIIVATCHGQFLDALLPHNTPYDSHTLSMCAALEQTLASQLIVVPFIYYPVFFTLTGLVQNLSPQATLQRARENFVPLMQRNLLFWIPVQYVQFAYVPVDLQIPFLSVCGLAWTMILSLTAGATDRYQASATTTGNDEVEDQVETEPSRNLDRPALVRPTKTLAQPTEGSWRTEWQRESARQLSQR